MAFEAGAVVGRLRMDTTQAMADLRNFSRQANTALVPMGTGGAAAVKQITKETENLGLNARMVFSQFSQFMPGMAGMALRVSGPLGLIVGALAGMTLGFMAAKKAATEFFGLLERGINAIDRTKMQAAAMAANLQSAFPTATFEDAYKAAEAMIPLFEQMDAKFSGTGQQLTALAESLIQFGGAASVLNVARKNTEELRQAFVALAETIKMKAGGDFEMQVKQEMRNLLGDQRTQGGAITMWLKGLGADLPKIKAEFQKGFGFEAMIPYLNAAMKASTKLGETLSAQQATWQSITDRILRTAFLPAYKEVVSLATVLNKLFFDQNGKLTEAGRTVVTVLRGGWEAIKIVASSILQTIKMFFPNTKGWGDVVVGIAGAFLTALNWVTLLYRKLFEFPKLITDIKNAAKGIFGDIARLAASPAEFATTGSIKGAREAWQNLTGEKGHLRGLVPTLGAFMSPDELFYQNRLNILGLGNIKAAKPAVPDLGAPRAPVGEDKASKAHKAAQDALAIEKERLQTAIEMAATDEEKLRLEQQLVLLYQQYSRDPRLTTKEQVGLYRDAMKLEREMGRERTEYHIRDLEFIKDNALGYAGQREAMEELIALYHEQSNNMALTQTQRVEYAGKARKAEEELAKADMAMNEQYLDLAKKRATTWEQERTVLQDTLAVKYAALETARMKEQDTLALEGDIEDIKRSIWEGDRQHVATLNDIREQEALTLADLKAALQAKLAVAEQDAITGEDEKVRQAARADALRLRRSLADVDQRERTQQMNYSALMAKSTADELAVYDEKIAAQEAIIAAGKEQGYTEEQINAAQDQRTRLIRERAAFEQNAQAKSLEYSVATAESYEDQRKAMLALTEQYDRMAEVEDIRDEERQARQEKASAQRVSITRLDIAEANRRLKLDEAEGMTEIEKLHRLRQLEQELRTMAETWTEAGEKGQAALKEINKELERVTAEIRKNTVTWNRIFRNAAQDWSRSFSDYFFDMMQGKLGSLRDLFASVLQAIQRQLADFLAAKVTQGFLNFLLNAVGAGAISGGGGGSNPYGGYGSTGIDEPGGLFDVPHYATGGIVRRPTLALVGESGPEAIIPLDKAQRQRQEVHVHVHAIDTQTGIGFLMKNRKELATALSQAASEGHPVGRRR